LQPLFLYTLTMQKIILASKSPRRKQLLESANIPFEVITKNTRENYPPTLSVEEVAKYLAQKKAKAVAAKHPDRIVLAADTIVTIHNTILGKPTDREDAIHMLQVLSNQVHTVITGVCMQQHDKEMLFSAATKVYFNPLTIAQIEYYIDTYKPYDKAGAYGIQDWIGVIGIHYIKGDFYNVMGLPVNLVLKALGKFSSD
jgi:septum formation protein